MGSTNSGQVAKTWPESVEPLRGPSISRLEPSCRRTRDCSHGAAYPGWAWPEPTER